MNYYLYLYEKTEGPFTEEEISQRIKSGAVTADTLVCEQGSDQWFQAKKLMPPAAPTASTIKMGKTEFTQAGGNNLLVVLGLILLIPGLWNVATGLALQAIFGLLLAGAGGSLVVYFNNNRRTALVGVACLAVLAIVGPFVYRIGAKSAEVTATQATADKSGENFGKVNAEINRIRDDYRQFEKDLAKKNQ